MTAYGHLGAVLQTEHERATAQGRGPREAIPPSLPLNTKFGGGRADPKKGGRCRALLGAIDPGNGRALMQYRQEEIECVAASFVRFC